MEKESQISKIKLDKQYVNWLKELKSKIQNVQLKAAVSVNKELLTFYWSLGEDIVIRQKNSKWGEGFIKQLSRDLSSSFPDMKGFSFSNLKYIKQWYLFYSDSFEKSQQAVGFILEGQQLVAQITQIPWGHNIKIITKCKTKEEALFYVNNTMKNNWSRSVLEHQIESGLWQREGTAITNFSETLPKNQSDLAKEVLKDPYIFDFLSLSKEHNERDLELGLIKHITSFLLELGAGFAYLGRQFQLQVGKRVFFIDLLFYHTKLHCYILIELKTGEFEPEYAGKLNFYLKAVDEKLKKDGDEPTIGILLCKNKDKLVAEYSLSDIHKPIGVSEYQLTQLLPESLKTSLPSIEDIETELAEDLIP
jgi:predicted nuclease of restriction endonuclease-like (RecB) superfamily